MWRAHLARWGLAASVIGVSLVASAASGQPAGPDARERAVTDAARSIMVALRYAIVVTNGDSPGWPQARPIDAFAPDERLVVWFATNPKSRKVAQLRRDPHVTLHYFDVRAPELGYVTLFGRARLVDDAAEKQKRWKEGWEAFWPDRGASYLLVEVTPERVEVFSPKHGIEADPVTWRPAAVPLAAAAVPRP